MKTVKPKHPFISKEAKNLWVLEIQSEDDRIDTAYVTLSMHICTLAESITLNQKGRNDPPYIIIACGTKKEMEAACASFEGKVLFGATK